MLRPHRSVGDYPAGGVAETNGGFQIISNEGRRPPTRQVDAFPRDLEDAGTNGHGVNGGSPTTPRSHISTSQHEQQQKKKNRAPWRSNSFSSSSWDVSLESASTTAGDSVGVPLAPGAPEAELSASVERKRREYKGGNIMARGGKPLKPKSLKILQPGYHEPARREVSALLRSLVLLCLSGQGCHLCSHQYAYVRRFCPLAQAKVNGKSVTDIARHIVRNSSKLRSKGSVREVGLEKGILGRAASKFQAETGITGSSDARTPSPGAHISSSTSSSETSPTNMHSRHHSRNHRRQRKNNNSDSGMASSQGSSETKRSSSRASNASSGSGGGAVVEPHSESNPRDLITRVRAVTSSYGCLRNHFECFAVNCCKSGRLVQHVAMRPAF